MWPLSRYPRSCAARPLREKSGVYRAFLSDWFFGPLRASVPLVAGIFEMPYWRFQIANFTSALVWAAALLLFGDVIAIVNGCGARFEAVPPARNNTGSGG